MPFVQYIFSGLVQLLIEQIVAHKADIEKLVLQFLESLLARLKDTGHVDTVHKIQAVVSSHTP